MFPMKARLHGIISLGLIAAAIVVAALAILRTSPALGVLYGVGCAAAAIVILYAYCAKCPARTCCGHVFPGMVAIKVLKGRPSGPYTAVELAATGLSLLILIGLPQVWLWRHGGAFIAFWVMTGVALIQIRGVVCGGCKNIYCPGNNARRQAA